jgi:hypothetical protein
MAFGDLVAGRFTGSATPPANAHRLWVRVCKADHCHPASTPIDFG